MVASAFLVASTPLQAQGVNKSLDDADKRVGQEKATIVVTGQRTVVASESGTKTNTPLIETPQSITRIDNDELVRRDALSINQALQYVAGVAPDQRGGNVTRYDQLTLRGYSPTVFLDGMRLEGGSYATPQIDFHRIESVDIVKGPASVLYGNSTPGGLINLTSKVPTSDPHGQVDLQGGNYNLVRGAVNVGGPLAADGRLRFRIIGGGERSDGFTDYTKNSRYYVNPSISFVPDAATSLTLIGFYQRDPDAGSYGSVPTFGSALPNPNGRLPVSFYDGEPSYEAFDRKQWGVTALFRHNFGDVLRYTAHARFYQIDQSFRWAYGTSNPTDFTATYRTLVRGAGGSDEHFGTTTIDNNLAGTFRTGPLRHELLAGLDYLHNQGHSYTQFATGAANGVPNLDIFAPVYGVAIRDILAGAPRVDTKRDQVGVYGQDQISVGGLNLIGSVRQDWYEQTSVTTPPGRVAQVTQDKLTYRLGALYAFRFGVSPYFSYSTSFEPQTGTNLYGQPYLPVTGRQYEAGLKYQPPGTQTIVTVSVYDLARQNVPVTDPANRQNQIQVGEQKTRGIEVEGRGELAPGLLFTLAGTYMDAKFTKGNPAVAGVVNGGLETGATGTLVLGVPHWVASSFVSYDLARSKWASGPLAGLTVGGGIRYVGPSEGLFSLLSNGVTTLGRFDVAGRTLVDVLLGYDLGALSPRMQGFSLGVNGANILDKRYVSTCFAANWCWYGAPRTVTGSLRYRW